MIYENYFVVLIFENIVVILLNLFIA